VLNLFVDLDGFRRGGCGRAFFFELVCGGPVDQGVGKFFPFLAFGAVVADAVSFDFVFSDQLLGTVFEDEAVRGFLLGCDGKGEEQGEDGCQ